MRNEAEYAIWEELDRRPRPDYSRPIEVLAFDAGKPMPARCHQLLDGTILIEWVHDGELETRRRGVASSPVVMIKADAVFYVRNAASVNPQETKQ